MNTFLEDVASYLGTKGYEHITCDFLPDQPDDVIGLFLWSHTVGRINDGTGTRYVQVRVRAKDPMDAYATAHALAPLLDSGMDEERIQLTSDRWCIGRIRRMPTKMDDDGQRTQYYFEAALWGDNRA